MPERDREAFLASREDVFPRYTKEGFEAAFGCDWTIERIEPIRGSDRYLYLMRRGEHA